MTQVQEAPAETQIQEIVEMMVSIQEKLANTKATLKGYKIKSDRLTDFMKAKKELAEQISEEKDRIESELYEDKDYEKAKNDELTLKNQLKEQKAMLGVVLKQKNNIPSLQTEDLITKHGQFKLQLEFSPAIYLNGKQI